MSSVTMDSTELPPHTKQLEEEEEEVESEEEEALVPPPSSWFDETPTSPLTSNIGTNDVSSVQESSSLPSDDDPASETDCLCTTAVGGLEVALSHDHYTTTQAIGNTHPSPSWKEISSQVLPAAARELWSSSLRRIYYTARLSYARGRWYRKYSDIGNNSGGYSLNKLENLPPDLAEQLPPFSSLSWIDRQLVKEWRTYLPDTPEELKDNDEDEDFERARTLVPNPQPRPKWQKADVCHSCHKHFGPTKLRHHCRLCGCSYCHSHSSNTHGLPHLGYDPDVPERVCDRCKHLLLEANLCERVAWRLARCRDFQQGNLTPYFETGIDSAEEVALRITKAAIAMAKSIPLGAQATVAVETVDVLRKYGLHGIYGIMLRQEFLAAADLLRKSLGINKTAWPLSVHELSAAIFYALAQHRAIRGLNPEREHNIHQLRQSSSSGTKERQQDSSMTTSTWTKEEQANSKTLEADNYELSARSFHSDPLIDQTDTYNPNHDTIEHMNKNFISPPLGEPRKKEETSMEEEQPSFDPVCDAVSDSTLASLVFYAPIALNFVYAIKEVDMQLLAAQQGWRLLYAYLDQNSDHASDKVSDRPASAIFLHHEHKIACLAVRGTATINDVVTDIRQIPVPFPDTFDNEKEEEDWTNIFRGQGLALCGMASAAVNLYREHVESLVLLAKDGYRIRLTGHSLGGGVATMVGVLVLRHLERYTELATDVKNNEESDLLRVYSYGTPSCMDGKLADSVDPFVTTVVLHDDVFPRLTPTSCRALLKHLLHIRETWVKTHIQEDIRAVGERAKQAWAPRFRQPFTLTNSSSLKKYCKKQILKGKKKLLSVKAKSPCGEDTTTGDYSKDGDKDDHWGEKFFAPTSDLSFSFDESGTAHHDDDGDDGDDDFMDAQEPQLLLEFLGGVDTNRVVEGIVIDGDEFFDTGENLVENDDNDDGSSMDRFCDPATSFVSKDNENDNDEEPLAVSDSWSMDMTPMKEKKEDNESSDAAAAVVLEETPLPRMFIPGKIIHVYSHRGVYKCAQVPRSFRELRRMSLAGNMLSNHTTKSYYEGLLEVQTARVAPESPPRWTSFDEDDTCSCCASRFTWASTSNSEAQEARDKHNCRSCGGLVCDPCAKNRVPIPSIGITVPVRVCDRCYNDMGCSSLSRSSSFLEVESRPERQREKRSVVVDDLASKMLVVHDHQSPSS